MHRSLITSLLVLTLCPLAIHQSQAATAGDELLAALTKRVENNGDVSEIFDSIEDLPNSEVTDLYKKVERVWPRLRDAWISDFQRIARDASGKSGNNKNRIRDLRKELAAMQGLADGPMKEALKKRGMPAIDELRSLLVPKTKDIIATADDAQKKKRRTILAIARLRDILVETAIIPLTQTSVSELTEAENTVTRALSGLDRKGLKIMENNRKTAEKKKVPEPERIGVADANMMRLLAGLSALEIDPKLCEAARDHSKDMETLNFFAHESPVKGKRTPNDRAKNFGTSASGENIYAGSTDPLSANKGWFYSPGHHRNMFSSGHRRIGLGQHNRHWTQLFGR
ncbi:hypothetical protein NT6N_25130 [Oceaniferula spumae]|uniref:SCP domain-containing protein n=1 Tax=Oceaniferula spumae TaxID=2979115 RepID=A0AAT9FND6_9BACT